ncbi:hypothetical protein NDU88_002894 [Pleurodeles waltl]|uniref:Uncharacterized protein n=1 Tax=Pleurodeles waltl TaxID=8319 RepID=A0AAV7UB30_PLEWA|nr:hypothetical protein NDU88_002894 [Pleurodeles waltl]
MDSACDGSRVANRLKRGSPFQPVLHTTSRTGTNVPRSQTASRSWMEQCWIPERSRQTPLLTGATIIIQNPVLYTKLIPLIVQTIRTIGLPLPLLSSDQ